MITLEELDALAGERFAPTFGAGSKVPLSPRQRLVLCLVLLRGGVAVRAERIDADLAAWIKQHGEPTADSVAVWVRENRPRILFGVEKAQERRRSHG